MLFTTLQNGSTKEVLGRGDYWLMLGLGGIIYWENLPLLIFIASFTASLYGLYQKSNSNQENFYLLHHSYVVQI